MSKRDFRIDRLEIRLKGVASDSARAAVAGLGQDLMSELAGQQRLRLRVGRKSGIERIDSGVVRLAGESRPAELRSLIARRVAAAIGAKFK